MRRGQIWLASLPPTNSSVQGNGIRPVVLASNNLSLLHSPVIHAIPITSQLKKPLPTHVAIPTSCGITMTSTALCEQSMLLPKDAFIKCVGVCDQNTINKINNSLMIQFDLCENKNYAS